MSIKRDREVIEKEIFCHFDWIDGAAIVRCPVEPTKSQQCQSGCPTYA